MTQAHRIRRRRPTHVLTAGGLSLALTLAGCTDTATDHSGLSDVVDEETYALDGTTIRLGAAQEQALGVGTSYLVEILQGWGAEVEFTELTNLTGLEAMVANQIDMAARSSDESLKAIEQDVDVSVIGEPNSSMHYALVAEPGIDDVADLEGQEIAISGSGGFDTFLLRHLLPEADLNPDSDVDFIPIGGSGERTSALIAGQASAAIVFIDDWIALQEQDADLQLVDYIQDLVSGLSARTYYADAEFLENNPEVAEAVACANLEANRLINDDKDAFVDYTTSNVQGSDADEVAAFHDTAMELDMFPTDPDGLLDADKYTQLAELLVDNDEIDDVPDVDSLLETDAMTAAADNGCGR